MCNANGHRQPCGCGFGPLNGNPGDPVPHVPPGGKFQGRVYRGPRTSFPELASENVDVVHKALLQMGEDKNIIKNILQTYKAHGFPLSKRKIKKLKTEEKRDFYNDLKRLLGIRRYKIEQTKTMTIRVPLFTFSAPPVDKSKVIYEETTDFTQEVGWVISLLIPGVGMGASQEFKTQFSCTYSCRNGMFKTVFVPVRIRVSKLGI